MAATRHWKRLNGRWVLKARLPWKDYSVYYRGNLMPIRSLSQARSFPDEAKAKAALRFMKRRGVSLNWYPIAVNRSELFREIMRFM